jgi:transposase-like protein
MTKALKTDLEPLPADLPGRIELVGTTLFGDRWHDRLAKALGIARSSLYVWLAGKRKDDGRDIDAELLGLLYDEDRVIEARQDSIADLRRRFMRGVT